MRAPDPIEYAAPRMDIELLREHWDALGRSDPLWAVLTDRGRERGGWDVDEFLRSGAEQVDERMRTLDDLGVRVPRGRALDFGCGVGRLTQALAERFESCDGVDVAPSMIELARRINRHGDRCRYHLNATVDLALFPPETFDFVLSLLVLQHLEPRHALRYVREFVRLLRPDGVALFQLPAERRRTAPRPLPAEALRARIEVADPPSALARGAVAMLEATVRNDSPVAWPAAASLRLGNHWRSGDGRLLVTDDGRAELGRGLEPGESVEVALSVTAPRVPGPWTLELDLVQEHVAWFEARGAEPLRIVVADSGGDGPAAEPAAAEAGPAETLDPWIPMHVVPRDEVVAFVESCGGSVEHVFPDRDAGDEYVSFHYVVRRAGHEGARASLRRAADAVSELPDRPDMLPPITSRRRRARRGELAVRRAVARATRWFTIAQVEHDRAATRALMEMQAVIAAHEAELKELRAELARRSEAEGAPGDDG